MSLQWQLFRIIMVLSQWMGLNLSTMLQTTEGFKEFYIQIYTKSLVVLTPKRRFNVPKLSKLAWSRCMIASRNQNEYILITLVSFLYQSLVCGSPWADSGFPCTMLRFSWWLAFPSECSEPGRSHWRECSVEVSGLSIDRTKLTVACLIRFVAKESCTGNRQTGHVDCFLSHTSMQDRWKLWPHLGMIRNTSFSWYSPKHIEHLLKKHQPIYGSWKH